MFKKFVKLSCYNWGEDVQPLVFNNCQEVYENLNTIMRDFSFTRTANCEAVVPQIVVEKKDDGYWRHSAWLDAPTRDSDPLDSACDLTVDIIHAYIAATPGLLCLHSAAVVFDDGLYLILGGYGSGKSLLTSYLSYLGTVVYTDDALPINSENQGVVLSMLPRLRFPLPEDIDTNFKKYVQRMCLLRNNRYCYLRLNTIQMPLIHTSAPIAGIILLSRSNDIPPKLVKIGKSEALRELILRNFAKETPLDIVDRFMTLVNNGNCFRLTYSNIRSGAELLLSGLSGKDKKQPPENTQEKYDDYGF